MPEKTILVFKSAWCYPIRRSIKVWFGKYRGQPLEEVPEYYINWYIENGYDKAAVKLFIEWRSSIEKEIIMNYNSTQDGFSHLHNCSCRSDR